MTRVLTFDGPRAARRFELLLTSFLAGGDGKGDRTPAIIRKEARLHEALESISAPYDNGTDPAMRVLTDKDASLVLPQEDFELLQFYTEKTSWTPRASREVVDLWDWLSASEKRP